MSNSQLTLLECVYNILETYDRCITQLAKMNIDPTFVELTADVVGDFLYRILTDLLNGYHLSQICRVNLTSLGHSYSYKSTAVVALSSA